MILQAEQLCKSFGEKRVLTDVCFLADAPGIYSIDGASGSGKTTLLRIIAGLEHPDSGTVSGYSTSDVAYVFQEPRLLPHATVLQNVLCVLPPKKEAKAIAQSWLCAVGLSEVADERPAALSGGMQTRLSFARALAAERPILLLDEPFNGLDSETRARMIALLGEHGANKLILIVSHHREELALLGAKQLYSFA